MRILIILLFISNFSFFAQESFEFKIALPPDNEVVNDLNSIYFGSYINEETGTEFLINDKGITMISVIHSYISQEQVRESSKYSFRNGYLFGVVENDSVLYLQEDDKYFFGIKHKIQLNDSKNQAVIKKNTENSYIINFNENNHYTPSLMIFVGNKLTLKHFDYPLETKIFDKIKVKEKNKIGNIENIVLSPNQNEWAKLDQKIIFGKENIFIKK